jgi:GH15 family glucan-1,4-alpha-glucosidase
VSRTEGYAPIRDYAVLGDGRTVALVARDGGVDWLTLPTLASPPVFARLLDAESGGTFQLRPSSPFEVDRRYLEETNVLETTYRTETGTARVTESVNLLHGGLLPWFEFARRVEGLAGDVELEYLCDPRFPFADDDPHGETVRDYPSWRCGETQIALMTWGENERQWDGQRAGGRVVIREGKRALLVLISVQKEPQAFPDRDEVEARIDATAESWRAYAHEHEYEGEWKDAVTRSALVLKLLVYAPDGGIIAAPTTSLPEELGGTANWDYRYGWVRDSAYTLDALIRLRRREPAHESFSWLVREITQTAPDIRPLYRLEGSPGYDERELELAGYRGSRPVRTGNRAWTQRQLGVYGDLLDTAWRWVGEGNALDVSSRELLVSILGSLSKLWRRADSGFWEIRGGEQHYTSSKIGAWLAFDRATRLAQAGELPRDDVPAWVRAADEIRSFVTSRCWSSERNAFRFYADEDKLDATTLLASRAGFVDPRGPELTGTIDAVRAELGAGGPLLYRHSDSVGKEGAFVACSFWLIEALARNGRVDDAAEALEQVLALANDVGIYSEEIDPSTHEFLGNVPQGLSHLSLVLAATTVAEARASSPRS